jgi:hypothetical protein
MIKILSLLGLSAALAFAGQALPSKVAADVGCCCGAECACEDCQCDKSCEGGDVCCCATSACCAEGSCGGDAGCCPRPAAE